MLLATIIAAHRCARIDAEFRAWSDGGLPEGAPEAADS